MDILCKISYIPEEEVKREYFHQYEYAKMGTKIVAAIITIILGVTGYLTFGLGWHISWFIMACVVAIPTVVMNVMVFVEMDKKLFNYLSNNETVMAGIGEEEDEYEEE